jgi:hypothetical protein
MHKKYMCFFASYIWAFLLFETDFFVASYKENMFGLIIQIHYDTILFRTNVSIFVYRGYPSDETNAYALGYNLTPQAGIKELR